MNWFFSHAGIRRRRAQSFSLRPIEAFEERVLLADGITPSGGPLITVAVGTPISNAVFASFVVSDPSGAPGTMWNAKIDFGDGQSDKNVRVTPAGNVFEFVDSHTYKSHGGARSACRL